MAQALTTIADLERELVARIAALDGSAFKQGARVGQWREAQIPLSVVQENQAIGHLSYNVFVEAGRNSTIDRDRAFDGWIKLISDVAVLFAYHVRPAPDVQLADQRAGSDAALQVARALLANPQSQFQLLPVTLWRPSMSGDGEWMLVRLDFTAIHEISLT